MTVFRKALVYGAGLIALYLAVANATGFGNDLKNVDSFVTDESKTLQGR